MDRFGTFEQFASFLESNQVRCNIDRNLRIVELTVNAPPLPGSIYVKWETQFPVFTFIQIMIENIPPERVSDLETAIVRLNTVAEVGGFSYDHSRNRIFCRLSVPVFPQEPISANAFDQVFKMVVMQARGFVPIFQKVIDGAKGSDIEKITAEYAAQLKAQGGAPAQ
ncbi:MAG: hypothetical protein ACKV2T_07025 [Kofleriaceae bacterium]